ncbi:MAG: DUF5009 domain-containing protein [Verrucomicrobiales bacterium]|nr:DUF5009 domain-containing protein [Verrucomicrobiales bacterium]
MATTKITPSESAQTNTQTPPAHPSAAATSTASKKAPAEAQKKRPKEKYPRLYSLDAYRGLIMISLAFGGFGLAGTAQRHLAHLAQNPDDGSTQLWETIYHHFHHVDWTGWGYWDLIQPSFMFMVGVSMAYSYTKRAAMGHSWFRMFGHVVWRSLVLILLGVFLSSNGKDQTNWSFMNVLAQIGLGYSFLFIFWRFPWKAQALGIALILVGTWAIYTLEPNTGIDLENGAAEVGVSAEWAQEHLKDLSPAWHKNANIGQHIDLYLLNNFPRKNAFIYNGGGYQTLNFIPSLATMLFGLMAGELLRSSHSHKRKFWTLIIAGALGLIIGQNLDLAGVIPMVKRIWTPSWVLYSAGWCSLILAVLYGIIDIMKWRWGAYPLIVVGVNSLLMYFMAMLFVPWTRGMLKTHLGEDAFNVLGEMNSPFVQATAVGLFFWLICWYLYRQKIFLRI